MQSVTHKNILKNFANKTCNFNLILNLNLSFNLCLRNPDRATLVLFCSTRKICFEQDWNFQSTARDKIGQNQKLKIGQKSEIGQKLKIGQNWKIGQNRTKMKIENWTKLKILTALSSSVNNVVCWLINILVEILDVYNLSRKYWTFSMYFGCLWWPFREPSLMALFFISITASAINMTVFVCLSRTRIKASAKSRRTLGSLGLDFSKAKTSRKLWA